MLTKNISLSSADDASIRASTEDASEAVVTANHRILCYGDSLTAGLCNNCGNDYFSYANVLAELLGCPVDHIGHLTFFCYNGSASDAY